MLLSAYLIWKPRYLSTWMGLGSRKSRGALIRGACLWSKLRLASRNHRRKWTCCGVAMHMSNYGNTTSLNHAASVQIRQISAIRTLSWR